MTVRQTGDDDGSTASWAPEFSANYGRNGDRAPPERSRTLSNSEVGRDMAQTRTGGLQHAATSPNMGNSMISNQLAFSGGSAMSSKGVSKSEDGHSSRRDDSSWVPPPVPQPQPSSGYAQLQSQSQAVCAKCSNAVTGQFVRALGVVFHRACFTCKVSAALSGPF